MHYFQQKWARDRQNFEYTATDVDEPVDRAVKQLPHHQAEVKSAGALGRKYSSLAYNHQIHF